MKRITSYICLELLAIFAVALTAITVMMLIVGLAMEASRQHLGFLAILRLIPYALPNALLFAVPGTLLFAICRVYGRMSADNEVLAIKSMGISPSALIWPGLVSAFLLSLVTVWLNDISVSWGRQGIHRVVIESVDQIIYGRLRAKKSYSNPRISISVKRVDGRRLIRPRFVLQGSGNSPPITLIAQEAHLRRDEEKNLLLVVLKDGEMNVGTKLSLVFPKTHEQEIPLSHASRKGNLSRSPSDCPLRFIAQEIEDVKKLIQRLEQQSATQVAIEMLMGEFAAPSDPRWNRQVAILNEARERLARLKTEPWRRWANGFSCFFFVLVGAPLAIRIRNDDMWTTFGLCFIPILIVYYPLLMIGVAQAKSGALHPVAVWMGNGVLLLVGYWILRQVTRH